ncbi:Protein of unknown function [Bacillus mycoides]|nr:Protein of unknown function [Bacillus mycoides]
MQYYKGKMRGAGDLPASFFCGQLTSKAGECMVNNQKG